MPRPSEQLPYTCARCLHLLRQRNGPQNGPIRSFSKLSPLRASKLSNEEELPLNSDVSNASNRKASTSLPSTQAQTEPGAMSRRLAQATEDAVLEGGRAGRKAVEEAGFSEELKERLLERVNASKFRSENVAAFAEAETSSKVGKGTKGIATGAAWSGIEAPEDTMLRMLDDARKPLKLELRGPAKIPQPNIDMRLQPKAKMGAGQRLANARDKSSIYALAKDAQMTDKEREEWRKELKERFTPDARAMPNSLRGLAALANERIEDAIARGQFKNIPRGKKVERDTRADNPFIDATEYILNKMIQRQDIVPPWIEKQQELVKAAHVFRARLRNDWKRHAARTISSRGGSLQEQMRIADRYAEAERIQNPKRKAVDQISVPTNATSDPIMGGGERRPAEPGPAASVINPAQAEVDTPQVAPETSLPSESLPPPFRIPAWEAAELSYLTLAITNLNNLTRSYNLMAPDLAKKPYFNLDRELKSCYADVAPLLSATIQERAARPAKVAIGQGGHRPGSILDRFASDSAVIHDSKKPLYGFREFWNDLFKKDSNKT